MFYRVRQFAKAVFPRVKPSEITWAADSLPLEARSLFLRQSPAELRHALDVAQDLAEYKNRLTPADYQDLIAAALLHDCGKTETINRLWHRIYVVLRQKLPSSLRVFLEKNTTVFAAPLRTACLHAAWGSDLAQKAGLNPTVCSLIAEHHKPNSALGLLLAQADNRH